MGDIMTLLIWLHLTRPLTTFRNVRRPVGPIYPGFPVHGPINPGLGFY
uniref:AC4 n=1 Tax=Tomato rugose yellow leaf curl virus TaxID=1162280 RepID=A0A193CHM3_9GEMI|nr:AC4 [Tomato rugose yellow leaf curl virus]